VGLKTAAKAEEYAALQTLRDAGERVNSGEAFGVRGIPALSFSRAHMAGPMLNLMENVSAKESACSDSGLRAFIRRARLGLIRPALVCGSNRGRRRLGCPIRASTHAAQNRRLV
jgi:hypothetical protein